MRRFLPLLAAFAASERAPHGSDPSELSDNTACRALGFADLSPYRRALPLASPYGATTNATPILLPYFSSAPLRTSTAATAVVFIHGLLGDANSYFCEGMAASAAHASTLVIAPWFGNEATAGAYWNAEGAASETLFWSNSRWSTGGTNTAPPKGWSTSFDLLDALLRALPPSVALVSVVGFSAGAQLSGRYALATPLGSPGDSFAPHVRFFVGDPGSFVYLGPARPAAACSPLFDTGPDHKCGAFAVPTAACAGYDDYKYGLQSLGYLNLYLEPLERNASARAEAVARFATKDLRIFLGSEDVCNCNVEGYVLPGSGVCTPEGGALSCSPDDFGGQGCCDTYPDAQANSLDHSCAAMLQGSNRLQRGLNYASHLESALPGYRAQVFTGAYGHSNSGMYDDAAFQKAAYSL